MALGMEQGTSSASDSTTGSTAGAAPVVSEGAGAGAGAFDVNAFMANLHKPKGLALDNTPTAAQAAEREAAAQRAAGEKKPGDDKATTQGGAATGFEFKITHKGKEVTLEADKYKNYAQMGLDYSSNMRELKDQRAEFDRQRQEFESQRTLLSEWAQLDEYARANPQWAALVREQYQRAQSQGFVGQPAANYQDFQAQRQLQAGNQIGELARTVQDLQARLAEQDQAAARGREAERNRELDNQVTSYKEKYGSDFDWTASDPISGNTLEADIMQFAVDNGIKRFDHAANAFLADKIAEKAALKAKEAAGKDIQKQTRLGLGQVTSKPQMNTLNAPENLRGRSYSDLGREALRQFGVL
jgi:hypothetical protein